MSDIPALIAAEAKAQGIDPTGPLGIWRAEGAPTMDATSPVGARGVMQLMPGTASDMGVDPNDLAGNIRGGVAYYKRQYDRFGDPSLAAAAYNAGPEKIARAGNRIPTGPGWDGVHKYAMTATTGANGPTGADIFDGVEPGQSAPVAQGGTGADIFADAPQPGSPPAAAPSGPATIKTVNGKIVFGDTGEAVPSEQSNTIQTLARGGLLNGDAAPGSASLPFVQRLPADTFKPGQFYVEAGSGKLRQTPGATNPDGGFGSGLVAGVGDVPNSLMKLFPFHEDSDVFNAAEGSRLVYDATHQGDLGAAAGRFTGQVLGSAPLLGGGEAALGKLALRAPEGLAPILDFLGGSGGGNLAMRTASRAARGAQEGAAGALLTSGASDEPVGDQVAAGAATGGVLRGAMPAVSGGFSKVFGGPTVSPAVADLARTAVDKYGIPLRATQIRGVGDPGAAIHDSEMLGRSLSGYAGNQAQQTKAFTRSIANTFGEDADSLSPDVMSRAKSRIGGMFNTVAQNTNIHDTNPLRASISDTVAQASQVLPDSDFKPIANLATNIQSGIKNGVLSGETYQALTRKGSALDVASHSSNANVRTYAQQLREHLDDALEASASPADLDTLSQARWQYKNLMTVKNLAAKANVEGDVSPALLSGAVNASFKNRAFTGAGDLGELAQIGQTFMKQPGNSQTAARLSDKIAHGIGGGALMGGLYMLLHDPHLALKMGAAGGLVGGTRAAMTAASGAAARSPLVVNQLIRGGEPNAIDAALATLRNVSGPAYIPAGVVAQRNGYFPSLPGQQPAETAP